MLKQFDDATLKEILRTFFESSFDAIVITSAEPGYPIVYANPRFCQMTGYALDELLGQSPRIFQGEKTNRRILEQLKRKVDSGEYFHGATINYRKNGQPYPVEWNISPIKSEDGGIRYYLSIQKDLSSLQKVLSRFKRTNEHFRHFLLELSDLECGKVATESVLQQQKALVPEVLGEVALYNPALRSDSAVEHFAETEFFDCSDDLFGLIAEPLAQQGISANEYVGEHGHRISAPQLLGLLTEVQDHLDFIPHSSNPQAELRELSEVLHELANMVFYLDEFVALSSVLNELANQTSECQAQQLPEFILDIFSALIRDLEGWVTCIFVEQSADDIHYLDASMISSAKQLMAFLRM